MDGPGSPTSADPRPLHDSKPRHPTLSYAEQYDCDIGDVFLTSGLGRTSQRSLHQALRLDWALISVHPARMAAYPGVLSNEPSFSTKRFVIRKRHKFQPLTSGKMVYKAGAATNTTLGILTGEVAEVRSKLSLPGGGDIIVHHQEHVVLDDDDDVPFADLGDSGAAVRARDGTILGMLWGGVRGADWQIQDPSNAFHGALRLRGMTFFTPAETLLEDMKAEIGKVMPGVEFTLRLLPHN